MFVIENIIESIFFGGCIALVLTVMVFLISIMVSRSTLRNVVSILVIGGYFIFAAVISSFVVGCLYTKSHIDAIGETVAEVINDNVEVSSKESMDDMLSEVIESYKSYGNILDGTDVKDIVKHVKSGVSAGRCVVESAKDKIDEYIEKWVKWLLFGTLMATVLSAAVAKGSDKKQYSDVSVYDIDNDMTSTEYY